MKIECTKNEKEWLLNAMESQDTCPEKFECPKDEHTCRSCLEEAIEWSLT